MKRLLQGISRVRFFSLYAKTACWCSVWLKDHPITPELGGERIQSFIPRVRNIAAVIKDDCQTSCELSSQTTQQAQDPRSQSEFSAGAMRLGFHLSLFRKFMKLDSQLHGSLSVVIAHRNKRPSPVVIAL